ncbi:MAG: hypothetical protein GY732_12300 [Gammaproteobacteria bacterium]|nr:hypothetical protein [Gammaproteobacteria bacterium]
MAIMTCWTVFVWIMREYFAAQNRVEKLWTNLASSFDHSFTTLIHPLPTLRRDQEAPGQNACGATTGFYIKKQEMID